MQINGGKDKFLSMIEGNKGIIYKVANSYCRDPDDRKDLVQEIIIQLWHSFSRYDEHYKLSTWMYRIALNVAISFYRKEKRRKDSSVSMHGIIVEIADENDENSESEIGLLQHAINELKELDKALIILYLEQNSYKEIAEILGITETNVASRISRVKEKLKLKLRTLNK